MGGLIDRIRSSREFSVELEPGKTLRMRRPLAAHMARFRSGLSLQLLSEYAVGWDGVTEADVLPAGVGGDGRAEFSSEVVYDVLGDKPEWYERVAKGLADEIQAFLDRQAATAKN